MRQCIVCSVKTLAHIISCRVEAHHLHSSPIIPCQTSNWFGDNSVIWKLIGDFPQSHTSTVPRCKETIMEGREGEVAR